MISSAGLSPSGAHLHVSASGTVSMVTHDRVDLGYSIPHERLVVGSFWSGNTEKIRVHSLFMRYFLAVNHEHV